LAPHIEFIDDSFNGFFFQMVSIWFRVRGPTYTPSMRMAVLKPNTICLPADMACVLVAGSAADTPMGMGNPYVFDHESLAREPRSHMSTRDFKEGSCAALRRKAV